MKSAPNIAVIVPTFQGYGGLEKYILDLTLALTRRYPVTVISQHCVNPKQIEKAFQRELPLDKIHFLVDRACNPEGHTRLTRWYCQRQFTALTRPYDLVLMSTWLTPWMQASKRGVLVCHFPGQGRVAPRVNFLSAAFREQRDLVRRLGSWQEVITSSCFGQTWLKTYWSRSSQVLYPGISLPAELYPEFKKPWILGCGFFSRPSAGEQYSYKRQELMIEAFRRLQPEGQLELHLAGHVSRDREGDAIMDRLRQLAEGLPVVFHPNCSGQELEGLYRQSSLFWHATGYGIDPDLEPFRLEHFGMVTVEAMTKGCVPVVYGQGGQREIVENQQSGFWWFNLDQLVEISRHLLGNAEALAATSLRARQRAEFFSIAQFENRALALTEAQLALVT